MAPAYQEAFGEFLKLKDLEERLGDRRFIGYTFEDVEGLWYQALLIPQKYEQDNHKQIVMLVIRDVSEQKRKRDDVSGRAACDSRRSRAGQCG